MMWHIVLVVSLSILASHIDARSEESDCGEYWCCPDWRNWCDSAFLAWGPVLSIFNFNN